MGINCGDARHHWPIPQYKEYKGKSLNLSEHLLCMFPPPGASGDFHRKVVLLMLAQALR